MIAPYLSRAASFYNLFITISIIYGSMLFSARAQVVRTGYTSIVAVNSSKCLDVYNASTTPGAAAIQLHCTSGATEQWTVQNYKGSFRIIQQPTGYCLVVAGGSATAGAQLVLEPCSGVNSELWSFVAND